MSKLGIVGWVGILLLVIGYVIIPEWAIVLTRQGYVNLAWSGGNASPGDLAMAIQRGLQVSMLGPPVGMAGVVLVLISFARRL